MQPYIKAPATGTRVSGARVSIGGRSGAMIKQDALVAPAEATRRKARAASVSVGSSQRKASPDANVGSPEAKAQRQTIEGRYRFPDRESHPDGAGAATAPEFASAESCRAQALQICSMVSPP